MLFKDVLVDEALKQQLVSLIDSGRVSHAQLFVSQPGSHQFALAIAYTQYLLCQNRLPSGEACGTCESCVKVQKLSHPDLHFYFPTCISKDVKKDPDSAQFAPMFKDFVLRHHYHIDINAWLQELEGENKQAAINVRDCSDILHYNSTQSYQGGYKVYILWCVDRLHHAAAPKLLKTLEEPEKNSLFILLTEQSDKILATIVSRTQLVKIPKLSDELIANQLIKDFQIGDEKARELAFVADGNYIKAQQLLSENEITREMLAYSRQLLFSCRALAQQQPSHIVQYLDLQDAFSEIIKKGREYQKNFFIFLSKMVRYSLVMKTPNAAPLLKVSAAEKPLLEEVHSMFSVFNVGKVMHELNQAIYHVERNGNSQLIFTDFYLKLSLLIHQ